MMMTQSSPSDERSLSPRRFQAEPERLTEHRMPTSTSTVIRKRVGRQREAWSPRHVEPSAESRHSPTGAGVEEAQLNLNARILIVDDEQSDRALLERILEHAGYSDIATIGRSFEVPAHLEQHPPDLLLLILHVPDPDGFEVMRLLERWGRGKTCVPILVLTADAAPSIRHRALEGETRDFSTKPFDQIGVRLRIGNLLQMRHLQIELQDLSAQLDVKGRHRTSPLNEARLEAFCNLALAAEYRHHEAGQCEVAPLHDVGRIGIRDSILLKPDHLTDQESSR